MTSVRSAPRRLGELGADERDHRRRLAVADRPRRRAGSRNASSSRCVGMIVSSRRPAATSAAATSERRAPSTSSTKPVALRAAPSRRSGSGRAPPGRDRGRRPRRRPSPALPIRSLTRAARHQPTLVHHDHVAAHLFDLAQVVTRQQHRRAVVGEPPDQLADLADLTGIQAVGRLVEHQQLRSARAATGRSRAVASCPANTSAPCGRSRRRARRPRARRRGRRRQTPATGLPPQPQVGACPTGAGRRRPPRSSRRPAAAPGYSGVTGAPKRRTSPRDARSRPISTRKRGGLAGAVRARAARRPGPARPSGRSPRPR